jgi:hypothetical protein
MFSVLASYIAAQSYKTTVGTFHGMLQTSIND